MGRVTVEMGDGDEVGSFGEEWKEGHEDATVVVALVVED